MQGALEQMRAAAGHAEAKGKQLVGALEQMQAAGGAH